MACHDDHFHDVEVYLFCGKYSRGFVISLRFHWTFPWRHVRHLTATFGNLVSLFVLTFRLLSQNTILLLNVVGIK